jgi:hypothetical protein
LNVILKEKKLVSSHCCKGQLFTFCCMEWEWEFYSRRPKALSYPFNLAGHCYWEKNSQVLMVHVI